MLKEFSSQTRLFILTDDLRYNIEYTFINYSYNKSLIDHFVVNSRLSKNILNVEALSEGKNLSDHLPVKLKSFYDMPKIHKYNAFSNNEIKFNWQNSLPQDKLNYKTIIKNSSKSSRYTN